MPTKLLQAFFILILWSNFTAAQPAKDKPIQLQYFSINVIANSFTVSTMLEMVFYNPNEKVLDGEYSFSLQPGQVISSFYLDINGRLREGVIVDKQQGRVAYENTIRRRIDPGLLEMTAGNNYRVRIYPMPAKGIRKIRISISELLIAKMNTLQYFLPLDVSYNIEKLEIKCSVNQINEFPQVTDGLLKERKFEKEEDFYSVTYSKNNVELKQPLSFEIPLHNTTVAFCTTEELVQTKFALHIKNSGNIDIPASLNSATILWDVSASSAKRNIKKEIKFLETFLTARRINHADVVTFSNTINEKRTFDVKGNNFDNLHRFLEAQQFDGGTQLASIDCTQFTSDIFLLFSDGLSNFGNDKIKMNVKPVYCINSSASANHSLLKKISAKSGTVYTDLLSTGVEEAIKELTAGSLQLLSVKQNGKNITLNSLLPLQSTGWFTLTGDLLNTVSDITLSFGKEGKVLKEEKINISVLQNCLTGNLDTACLLQQYESVQNSESSHEDAFAKQNHFVSSGSSFIVLDNVDDYIQYGITPPPDLQEEYLKKIYVVKQREEELKKTLANEAINNLRNAVSLYNGRVSWWDKKETLITLKETKVQSDIPAVASGENGNNQTIENPADNNNAIGFNRTSSLNEVVVVGYGTSRRRDITGSVSTVSASQISGAHSIGEALQGRVAGVQVTQNAVPGGADLILIRGASSLSGRAQPLYILDGVAVDANIINTVNLNNVQSIDVLKDVQASAVYGSRGANGVIIVSTRRDFGYSNQGRTSNQNYKDLEDDDQIAELKSVDIKNMYQSYLDSKDSNEKQPSFYIDMAQLLFDNGEKEKALRVLSNLTEIENENHQLQRAMGYVLESWKMYPQAIDVYKKVLQIKEEEPQSYRDLALAYERNGEHQQAVEMLYKVITKNFYQYEDRYRNIKSLLLNEMNAIISRHRQVLDLSKINMDVVKPLPVDLRIVIDWNKDETDIDLHVTEPGGEECFYQHKQTKADGLLSEDFTQGYGPEEYQIKKIHKGKYTISVNYFGDRYQKEQVPSIIKLTIYKNFGTLYESVTIQTFIMDKQSGKIEIADVKY